jgi:hypothetical protein
LKASKVYKYKNKGTKLKPRYSQGVELNLFWDSSTYGQYRKGYEKHIKSKEFKSAIEKVRNDQRELSNKPDQV